MTPQEESKALAKRIVQAINIGECWEDPEHDGEVKIVTDILLNAIQAERAAVWAKVMQELSDRGRITTTWCMQQAQAEQQTQCSVSFPHPGHDFCKGIPFPRAQAEKEI